MSAQRGSTEMTRRRWRWMISAGVLLAVVIAGALWRSRSTRTSHKATRPGDPVTAASAQASMPGMPGMTRSSAPNAGAAAHTVQLTADQIRQFGVTFGTAAQRELTNVVRAVGVVTVDSSRIVQVAPRFAGYVEHLYVDASGEPVRRGQPLMDVYSPELVVAEQELLVAANLQHSMGSTNIPGVASAGPDLVAAARQRLSLWEISDAQITQILRSGRARRTLTLFAPASGVVLDKNVVQGQAIQSGQMLYTIADLGNVWVDAQLRQSDASAVRPGARATIETAASPGQPLTGRVTYLYPTLDAQARTVRARVNVANATGLLRPGMYATVTLASPSRTALTVPTSAVLRTGERNVVFIDAGNGRLQPTQVTLGQSAGDLVEVLAGVAPGQRVVTSAQFLLDAEANLGDVMRSMIGQGGVGAMGSSSNMSDMPGMNTNGDMSNMNDKGADMHGARAMPTASNAAPTPSRTPAPRRER